MLCHLVLIKRNAVGVRLLCSHLRFLYEYRDDRFSAVTGGNLESVFVCVCVVGDTHMHYVRHANSSPLGEIHPFATYVIRADQMTKYSGEGVGRSRGQHSILWLKEHDIVYKSTDSILI